MEDFGDGGEMAREVALGPLGDAAATPSDEDVLGQGGIGILDFDKGKLDAALAEFFDQLGELTICERNESAAQYGLKRQARGQDMPPVVCTLRTLSLLPPSWNAFTSGA